MSWVVEFLTDFVSRLSAVEAAILSCLFAIMVAALTVPLLVTRRRQRDFQSRDEEFQRLQNL